MAASLRDIDVTFDLVEVGCQGDVEVVPKRDRSKERVALPLKTVCRYKVFLF